jgi:hypothetical protein
MRVFVTGALMVLISGCTLTEPERYQYNLTHAQLCPDARWLSKKDLDEISRLIAHVTPQTIWVISCRDRVRQELFVTTCIYYVDKVDAPDRNLFGFCELKKEGGAWRITYVAKDLSPALAVGFPCG